VRAAHLVLLRHGESVWNSADRFGGWVDIPLTAHGVRQAADAGRNLARAGLVPTAVHTSELRRAIDTASEVTGVTGGRPATRRSWRLNERHYGGWQGRSRRDVLAEVGEEYFTEVRRGWSARPPASGPRSGAEYPELRRPGVTAESLADVWTRLQPYWRESITRDLTTGAVVLVVAHGNSLRALVRHLDGLGEAELGSFELAVGRPRVYRFDRPDSADGHPPSVLAEL
jgi:2,3-bisphosphoglycerate-dependent phosphoglycerate mutase